MLKKLLKFLLKTKQNEKEYCCNSAKTHFVSSACTINFTTKNIEKIKDMNIRAHKFLMKHKNTKEIINFLNKKNVKVYKILRATKLLNFIEENPGVIFEKTGVRALFINIIRSLCDKKLYISLKSPIVFIFENGEIDFYEMAHNFHLYLQNKAKLPGFDETTLSDFKYVYKTFDQSKIDSLSYNDILSIKDTINRDIEAINFTLNLAKEIKGKNKAFKKMQETCGALV